MIKNYITVAWRYLKRHKAFAFTNVLGLSLGIACAILIFTLVTWHLGFDTFHANAGRIYRIVSEFKGETIEYQQGVPQPLGKAFRNDFTFAEKTARVFTTIRNIVSLPHEKDIKKFEEDKIAFAEPAFFDIFHFPLVQGDPKTALENPNTALITQKIAQKYFGSEDALGKIIRVTSADKKVDFTITGILQNIPANTDRKEEIYLSYANLKDYYARLAGDSNWGSVRSSMHCFVLLKPGITKARVDNALPTLVKKYYDAEDAKVTTFKLQPLSDIHFNRDFDGSIDKKYLWALALIGFFLIITACVNFVNLATAQALNRSREVGVRKVLGSLRSQLFGQFMAETALICLLSVVLAYGMAKLALPWINILLQSELTITLANWQLPVFLVALVTGVIFLAGSYPGLVLARFRPVLALKGKVSQKDIGGFSLRRTLVVSQFAISQMLIIGMIVIAGQMHYSKTADLGFRKDAIVLLPMPQNDKTKMNTLRTRFKELAGVENVSFCYEAPASGYGSLTDVRYDNRPAAETWDINIKSADDQYVPTYELKLVAGRNFFPSDTVRELLVNETVVKKLGLRSADAVIGKKLFVGDDFSGTITGVVKDFYNRSFHDVISPICIASDFDRFRTCSVKINLSQATPTLAALNKIWNETYPDYVYSHHFLDDRIANFYRLDMIMLRLVETFAGIAIIIGCLGLYGLVSFMAVKKTKEVGVRKVLGAGIHNILWLFGREFTLLLLVAFAIAAPIAWYVMHQWLQEFAFRIPVSPWIFLLAIAATFIVAALTVGYRSLQSALANPVKSLRTE